MADAATLYETYARAPMRFERGEGVWLVTETGERYLDFAAGVAVPHAGGHALRAGQRLPSRRFVVGQGVRGGQWESMRRAGSR